MGKANYAALSRVEVRNAALVFHPGRNIAEVAEDCALEALRVLHDGLSNPDDKLRLNSASAILNAHVKLAGLKLNATQLPPEERVERLRAALQVPDAELSEALRLAGYEQQTIPALEAPE